MADPNVREKFHELFQDIGACLLPIGSQRFGVDCFVEREERRTARFRRTVTHSDLPTECHELASGERADPEADMNVLAWIIRLNKP